MTFRCASPRFTQGEYERHKDRFYKLPTTWADDGNPSTLARCWKNGGTGLVSIIPILGLHTNLGFSGAVRLPLEKLSRLAGIDAATVRHGKQAFEAMGFGSSSVERADGRRDTQWSLGPSLAVAAQSDRALPGEPYFYFSAKVVYGGSWARLTGPQKVLYLALACSARAYPYEAAEDYLCYRSVDWVMPADVAQARDMSHDASKVRLASRSIIELVTATGLSKSAVVSAVRRFRAPDRQSTDDAKRALLRVYPCDAGSSHVYHFRDHALPWPWNSLNERLKKPPTSAPTVTWEQGALD